MLHFKKKPTLTEEDLRAAIAELNSLAAQMADSASAAAESAEDAATAARAAQRAAESAVPIVDERSSRRALWWALGCLTFLAVGICFIMDAVKAFADPALVAEDSEITVAVDSQGTTSTDRIGLWATVSGNDPSEVHYRFVFPEELTGHSFAIQLYGEARLDRPTSDSPIKVQDDTCQQTEELGAKGPQLPCQTITGTVPSDLLLPNYSMQSCGTKDGIRARVLSVDGQGDSAVRQPDWAHRIITLPIVGSANTGLTVDNLRGVALPDRYAIPDLTSCIQLTAANDHEIVKTYPQVEADARLATFANLGLNYQPVAETRATNAGSVGNLKLAIGAASIALAIGLFPIADQSRREWRQQKIHRKARHT